MLFALVRPERAASLFKLDTVESSQEELVSPLLLPESVATLIS